MYTLALTPSRSDFYNPMNHLREFREFLGS